MALCLLPCALSARVASALDPALQPFPVRTWERPGALDALAQGPDGLLWFASRTGLARFDGVRFVEIDLGAGGAPRAGPWVRRVLAASDGSIWAATEAGTLEIQATPRRGVSVQHRHPSPGLVRLDPSRPEGDPRRLRRFSIADGLLHPWVWALAERPGSGVWIGTEAGLGHYTAGRFERFSTADGLPSDFVTALAFAPDGALYVGTAAGVAVRREGRFVPTAIREPVIAVAADRAGRVWAGAGDRILRADPGGSVTAFPAENTLSIAVDPDDNVWTGPPPRVFVRGEPMRLSPPAGTDRAITGIAVDREGSVWLTTREGLVQQITLAAVQNFGVPEGLPGPVAYSVLRARDGTIYTAMQAGISRYAAGSWTTWRNDNTLGVGPKDLAEGPPSGPSAGIWMTSDRLLRGGPDGFRPVTKPFPPSSKGESVRGTVVTKSGDLWVPQWGVGVLHFRDGALKRPPLVMKPADGLCGTDLVHGLEAADGSIWFAAYYGSGHGGATRIKDGRARCYGPADGLPAAEIGAVTEDGEGTLWFGTGWGAGLVRFRDERFATIPANVGLPRTNITGLLDDGRGHLWVGSEGGVWRVPRADLDRCADRGCSGVGALVFGKPEGMRTPECTGAFHPNMALDGQGRVWVATLRGLSVFPPPERVPRAVATPVIEQVALDGVPAALADVVRVGWRQRELVVRYTTASFLEGARPQLKHRLAGFDGDWVLAGEQPVAHYHDLAAGTYTLEIRAGDDERSARRLTVVAEPPFWRTPTFFALLVLAGAAVGLGLHRMRMGRLQLRHRAVNAERARLARDLHDGLAQKLRAIGLLSDRLRLGRDEGEQVGGSERRLTPRLLELRQIVGEAYSELNRALWDLRAPSGTQRLETLIERTLSDVGVPSEVSVTLQTAAESLPVSGLVAHEVPLVVKEALVNAVRHARARNIEVGVLSDEDGLQVWVRDDGQGMPAERQAKAEGGYGIVGMHERARRLGGTLTIASEPGAGTEVALVVPRATQRGGRP